MTTAETRTPFPERMHRQAVQVQTENAANALAKLADEAAVLRHRLDAGTVTAWDTREAGDLVVKLAGYFGILQGLRETREWDKAERNG